MRGEGNINIPFLSYQETTKTNERCLSLTDRRCEETKYIDTLTVYISGNRYTKGQKGGLGFWVGFEWPKAKTRRIERFTMQFQKKFVRLES